jgi:hypothetical protein
LTAKLVINAPTFNGEYYIDSLPSNYFHILNCICKFTALVDNGCYDKDDTVSYSARKLTADMWPQIINNYYYLPTYKRPYYYIQDNMSIEFRCGARDKFELTRVDIDYLEAPQTINITQNQLDNLTDTSQTIEFPDYVCYEIINEAVKLILENSSDPRLQTNIPINQSILSPFPMMQQQS